MYVNTHTNNNKMKWFITLYQKQTEHDDENFTNKTKQNKQKNDTKNKQKSMWKLMRFIFIFIALKNVSGSTYIPAKRKEKGWGIYLYICPIRNLSMAYLLIEKPNPIWGHAPWPSAWRR